jgi:hypothetical protein
MDGTVLARVLRNRFEFSEALDAEGFRDEASVLRRQILCVMDTPEFREAANVADNTRYAIRGQLSLEDIARSTASGAAGGAMTGTLAGPGIGTGVGAAIGAGLGMLSQPFGAASYNLLQGRTSKSESQMQDLVAKSNRLAKMLAKYGAQQQAAMIVQISSGIEQRMSAVRTQRYNQLSEQYGLSRAEDKGMWGHLGENILHLPSYLKRMWGMVRSNRDSDGMERTSQMDQSGLANDPRNADDWFMNAFRKVSPTTKARGVGQAAKDVAKGAKGIGALPFIAGAATQVATDYALGRMADAIRGDRVVMMNLASDIGKMGAEMSSQTGDPTYIQYAQRIQQIANAAIPQALQNMQQQQMQGQQMQQPWGGGSRYSPVPNPYAQQQQWTNRYAPNPYARGAYYPTAARIPVR